MSATIKGTAAIITLIVAASALVGWFAPDSIKFLFFVVLCLWLTIACLKESTHA